MSGVATMSSPTSMTPSNDEIITNDPRMRCVCRRYFRSHQPKNSSAATSDRPVADCAITISTAMYASATVRTTLFLWYSSIVIAPSTRNGTISFLCTNDPCQPGRSSAPVRGSRWVIERPGWMMNAIVQAISAM